MIGQDCGTPYAFLLVFISGPVNICFLKNYGPDKDKRKVSRMAATVNGWKSIHCPRPRLSKFLNTFLFTFHSIQDSCNHDHFVATYRSVLDWKVNKKRMRWAGLINRVAARICVVTKWLDGQPAPALSYKVLTAQKMTTKELGSWSHGQFLVLIVWYILWIINDCPVLDHNNVLWFLYPVVEVTVI